MEKIRDFSHLEEIIQREDFFLLYASLPLCAVCISDRPKAEELAQNLGVRAYQVDLGQVPQAAGQLSLLSSPAVIVFYKGKEWHRQARIIDFKELEKRMVQLKEGIENSP